MSAMLKARMSRTVVQNDVTRRMRSLYLRTKRFVSWKRLCGLRPGSFFPSLLVVVSARSAREGGKRDKERKF